MRILAISDIHDNFGAFAPSRLPSADVCLVAGDLTNYGNRGKWRPTASDLFGLGPGMTLSDLKRQQGDELTRAERWLREMSAILPVYWIPGNHDLGVRARTFANVPNCTCLLNRSMEINSLKIHGVSLSPCYDYPMLAKQWDYMTTDPEMERAAFDFESVDIVLSHSPPLGHCDLVGRTLDGAEVRIGSGRLLDYIHRHAPRLVICGHVHEGRGQSAVTGAMRTTRIYNVACSYAVIEVG